MWNLKMELCLCGWSRGQDLWIVFAGDGMYPAAVALRCVIFAFLSFSPFPLVTGNINHLCHHLKIWLVNSYLSSDGGFVSLWHGAMLSLYLATNENNRGTIPLRIEIALCRVRKWCSSWFMREWALIWIVVFFFFFFSEGTSCWACSQELQYQLMMMIIVIIFN